MGKGVSSMTSTYGDQYVSSKITTYEEDIGL